MRTYEKLGIPEAERQYLAGVTAQYESEVVYHKNRDDLAEQGILFCDMDTALREYPELVKQYFGTIIPPGDNKFAALNTSVWSGGSFIYVPPGVEVRDAVAGVLPDQLRERRPVRAHADHRRRGLAGPLHRGLLGAGLHERLAALGRRRDRRQAARPGHVHDDPELVAQRVQPRHQARAGRGLRSHGVDRRQHRLEADHEVPVGVPGRSRGATGEVLSVAYAGAGQHQDAGAKMVHAAPKTTSKIISKSISKDGGMTTYRGLVRVEEGATGCKSHVQCDALILDEDSTTKTLPYMEVGERDAQIGHEATVSKIADEQLFYLESRGLSEEQAMGMMVNGFIEPITQTLPMEYAVEWSRLIELQMEGIRRVTTRPRRSSSPGAATCHRIGLRGSSRRRRRRSRRTGLSPM